MNATITTIDLLFQMTRLITGTTQKAIMQRSSLSSCRERYQLTPSFCVNALLFSVFVQLCWLSFVTDEVIWEM